MSTEKIVRNRTALGRPRDAKRTPRAKQQTLARKNQRAIKRTIQGR